MKINAHVPRWGCWPSRKALGPAHAYKPQNYGLTYCDAADLLELHCANDVRRVFHVGTGAGSNTQLVLSRHEANEMIPHSSIDSKRVRCTSRSGPGTAAPEAHMSFKRKKMNSF